MRKILFVALMLSTPAFADESPDDEGYCVTSSDPVAGTFTSIPSTRAECPTSLGIFIQSQLAPLGGIPAR